MALRRMMLGSPSALVNEIVCANCKDLFFADCAQEQLCNDCSEHGWIFIGPTHDDPTELVFNSFECTTDDAPF